MVDDFTEFSLGGSIVPQYTHWKTHTHTCTLVSDDIHRRTQESPPPSLIGWRLPTERFCPSVPIRWSFPLPSHENHENNRASQAWWAPAHRQLQTQNQYAESLDWSRVSQCLIYISVRALSWSWQGNKSWTLTWVLAVPLYSLRLLLFSTLTMTKGSWTIYYAFRSTSEADYWQQKWHIITE